MYINKATKGMAQYLDRGINIEKEYVTSDIAAWYNKVYKFTYCEKYKDIVPYLAYLY